MPDKPRVVQVGQVTTTDSTGKLAQQFSIRFMVGPHGPFTVTVPAADFSAASVSAAMQKVADTIAELPTGS